MRSPSIYTDKFGKHYRPLAACPFSELVAGSPYAIEGEAEVYFRRSDARVKTPALDRLIPGLSTGIYHCRVIALEEMP